MNFIEAAPIEEVTLESLVRIYGGGTPSRAISAHFVGSIPWVSPKDMKGNFVTCTKEMISEEALSSSATRLVPAGSVLVVVRSGVLKHSLPVAINKVPVAINQDMKALVCQERLDPSYLAHFLRYAAPTILTKVRATTADNIPLDAIKELVVPVYPLSEQRRIAAILDKVEELRRKRAEALAKIGSAAASVFEQMFGDMRNGKSYSVERLGSVVLEFRYGTSNKSAGQGFPALRIPNVIAGAMDVRDLKFVPVERAEFERLRLSDGDLLFVRTNGNPDYVGRCAIFETQVIKSTGLNENEFIFASYLIRARLSSAAVTPIFVRDWLQTVEGRRQLRMRAKTSAGQFNINTESLRAVSIPIPPLSLQMKYAAEAGRFEKLKRKYMRSLIELDTLSVSLQQRAFRGEL